MTILFSADPTDGGTLDAGSPWTVALTESGFGILVLFQVATDPGLLGSGLGTADVYDSQNGGFQPGWDAGSTFDGLFMSPSTASILPNVEFSAGSSHHFYLLTNDEIGNDTADFTFTTAGSPAPHVCVEIDGNRYRLAYPLVRRRRGHEDCSDVVDANRMKRIYPIVRRFARPIDLK